MTLSHGVRASLPRVECEVLSRTSLESPSTAGTVPGGWNGPIREGDDREEELRTRVTTPRGPRWHRPPFAGRACYKTRVRIRAE